MIRISKVKIKWDSAFAYAIGLIATDGNLSKDGRHINITSKDKELIIKFKKALKLSNRIGKKSRGDSKKKKYYVIQFGDINFYEYLLSIGLKPAKSRTLGKLDIPRKYFVDFLRGCIDGDGSIGSYAHPESKFKQVRTRLFSGSHIFLKWIKEEIGEILGINSGWISSRANYSNIWTLTYAKKDSAHILKTLYKNKRYGWYLSRKYAIYNNILMGEWRNWQTRMV